MSYKYIKLPCLQGSINPGPQALLDFDLPDYGTYNLSKSYLSFMLNVNTTETDPALAGIHAVYASQPQGVPLRNNYLIGDYNILSSNAGSVDNLQYSNVLNANMDFLGYEFEQAQSNNYKSILSSKDTSYQNEVFINNKFRFLSKTAQSQELQFEAKVPLNSFSSFCNTEVYPSDRYGKLRVHVQFKPQQITMNESIAYNNPYTVVPCKDANAANNYIETADGLNDAVAAPDTTEATKLVNGQTVIIMGTSGTVADRVIERTVAAAPTTQGTATRITLNANPTTTTGTTMYPVARKVDGVNIVGGAAGLNTNKLTVTNLNAGEGIETLRSWIGNPVIITGTNLTNTPLITRIVDGVWNVQYDQNENYAIQLNDQLQIAGGATATNLKVYLLSTKLPAIAFNDVPDPGAAGADIAQLTIPNTQASSLILWQGKKVKVCGTIAGAYREIACLIQSVTQNGADVDVVFLNTVFHLNDTETATNLRLIDVPAATITPVFSSPTIVAQQLAPEHRLIKKNAGLNKIVYPKFACEMTNIPVYTSQFSKVFFIEPSVRNVFAILSSGDLISDDSNLASYRWKINNVDKTNRDIAVHSGLELDNYISTFKNSSKPLRSLVRSFAGGSLIIPMCTLPVGQENMVQLTLNFDNQVAQPYILYLYKEGTQEI